MWVVHRKAGWVRYSGMPTELATAWIGDHDSIRIRAQLLTGRPPDRRHPPAWTGIRPRMSEPSEAMRAAGAAAWKVQPQGLEYVVDGVGFGWPLPVIGLHRISILPVAAGGGGHHGWQVSTLGAIELRPSAQGSPPSGGAGLYLPLRLLILPTLASVVLYGTPCVAVLAVAENLVRRRRRRRGACPFCSYDHRGGAPRAVCPECGERPAAGGDP